MVHDVLRDPRSRSSAHIIAILRDELDMYQEPGTSPLDRTTRPETLDRFLIRHCSYGVLSTDRPSVCATVTRLYTWACVRVATCCVWEPRTPEKVRKSPPSSVDLVDLCRRGGRFLHFPK